MSQASNWSVLDNSPVPARRTDVAHAAASDGRRDSTISPAPQPRQKRTLVDLENEDDEDDDTPSQINNLPSEMQTWAVSVGLKKKAIAELVRFGLLFQA
ncbi:hypothetical protein CF328_g6295, partial [Tilletia controversa]